MPNTVADLIFQHLTTLSTIVITFSTHRLTRDGLLEHANKLLRVQDFWIMEPQAGILREGLSQVAG